MNEAPLDKSAPAEDHRHEGRIIRLEVTVDNLASTLIAMQQRTDDSIRALHNLLLESITELRADQKAMRMELQSSIETLRTEMQGSIKTLRNEMQGSIETLRTEMQGSIETLRTEMQGSIETLRTEMQGSIETLRTEMQGSIKVARDDGQHTSDLLRADIQRLDSKVDRNNRWIIGLGVTVALGVGGLLIKAFSV